MLRVNESSECAVVFIYEKNAVVCSRQRKKSRHLQDMVIAPSYLYTLTSF